MITKIKLLRKIGKFYDFSSSANALDWQKNTFVFAPNAYGKSTLVNVLRSPMRSVEDYFGPAEAE